MSLGVQKRIVQQKVSMILVNPTDGSAIISAIEAANLANIPVITVDRGEGFNQAIADADVEIVASQPADFDRSKGLTVMENILQANPEIDAVFAHNDEMALGALQAIEASGRDIIVVGFDATDDAVKAVEDGLLAATVAQKLVLIGKLAVETAVKQLNGEAVDEVV